MEAEAEIEAMDDNQCTPLHSAAFNGHVEVCRVLTEARAAIDARNCEQKAPLYLAAQEGHAEVCRVLTEAGATIDIRDQHQCTPLHAAAANGHVKACDALMKAGAALEARDGKHATPLHHAAQEGQVEVCRMLTEAGAAVDARPVAGEITPLHLAAMFGHESTCILLAFKGADLTSRGSGHRYRCAELAGHTALAAHLRNGNGAHCLRCTGPSLEPRLLWNDTPQQQQDAMLDEMQVQWLAKVAEGCAQARVGLTLRGAFGGGLSTSILLHVIGYVFGGTQAHLQSCISTGRVAAARGLAKHTVATVAAAVVNGTLAVTVVAAEMVLSSAVPTVVKVKAGGTGRGGLKHDSTQHDQEQEMLPPRLALVSHALALAATPAHQPVISSSTTVLGAGSKLQLQAVLARLVAAAEAAEGGCDCLHGYCDFLQRRHRLVS
jgi:hypothetical protein